MFERCPTDERCDFCAGRRAPPEPRIAEVVYCVGAEEDAVLYARAQRLCHETGLCRETVFYRPARGAETMERARWLAQRAVAREALRCDDASILVLEFDVETTRPWAEIAAAAAAAIARLPPAWLGLHLAHEARGAVSAGRGLMRVRSASAWAYVANRPLIEWLARAAPPADAAATLDAAMAGLPRMYALAPSPMVRVGVYDTREKALARARKHERLERLAAPLRRLAAWRPRRGSDRALRERIGPAFDPVWYRDMNPDVAAAGVDPLDHYIRHGVHEGRPPNVWFDSAWYLRRYPDVAALGRNPLDHYLSVGKAQGRFAGADEENQAGQGGAAAVAPAKGAKRRAGS